MTTIATVCSGIGAPDLAASRLGWKHLWVSEIEAFPSAVLATRFPGVPNLGDMTLIADRIRSGEVEAPDVLVGGCPCQAFSVAGLRRSLDDARGNITMSFVELIDACDEIRRRDGKDPVTVVYENVPGLLNTKDNAFGCFLGALSGDDEPLVPPGGKWPKSGFVAGEGRNVAWRVLDSQYFGVAQRRRRVWLVSQSHAFGDSGAWACSSALFPVEEGEGRDSAAGKQTREDAPSDAGDGVGAVAMCIGIDGEHNASIEQIGTLQVKPHGNMHGAIAYQKVIRPASEEHPEVWRESDVAATLNQFDVGDTRAVDVVVGGYVPPVINTLTAKMQGSSGWAPYNEAEHLVAVGGYVPEVAVGCDLYNGAITGDTAATMTKASCSGPTVSGPTVIVGGYVPEVAQTVTAKWSKGTGGPAGNECQNIIAPVMHPATAFKVRCGCEGGGKGYLGSEELALTVSTGQDQHHGMQVRRLTPVECSRLQNFPDDWLDITYKGKPAADSNKYKSLGNSMTVNVVFWILQNIDRRMK